VGCAFLGGEFFGGPEQVQTVLGILHEDRGFLGGLLLFLHERGNALVTVVGVAVGGREVAVPCLVAALEGEAGGLAGAHTAHHLFFGEQCLGVLGLGLLEADPMLQGLAAQVVFLLQQGGHA
jgi:hypothetical protein